MSLSIWNPFRDMERLLDRWSGQRPTGDEHDLAVADWHPTVDIHETKEAYELDAELPGVERDDVHVIVDRGVLTIKGEKKHLKRVEEGGKTHRVESAYGAFARSFTLPDEVDEASVQATFDKGVLHLVVPKSERAKPRSIEVKVK